jgi:hypothetical protein
MPAPPTVPATAARVEREIATDLVRRAAIVAPVLVVVATVFEGAAGGVAILCAVVLVALNFALAALGQTWAVRTGRPAIIAANALGGFALRMGLVLLALIALRHQSWIHFGIFGITVATTHLGLLFWEMRSVSATLAFPGLKPRPAPLRVSD